MTVGLLAIVAATSGGAHSLALPRASLTPGAVRSVNLAQICTPGYAHRARRVPYRERDLVYTRYGLPRGHYVDGHYVGVRKAYVIDHLIPLELGGANAVTNLWPEPRSEARRKDRVEAKLHAAVCGHRLALRIAQRRIAADWRTALAGQVAK